MPIKAVFQCEVVHTNEKYILNLAKDADFESGGITSSTGKSLPLPSSRQTSSWLTWMITPESSISRG
jgi:hypothetical protein